MKKVLSLLALIPALLFAQTAWDGTADSTWYTSNKSATTYTITTAEQLAGLAAVVNRGTNFEGKTIRLGANIVLNDTNAQGGWRNWDSTTTGLKHWTIIGNGDNTRFSGYFDGNGKIISGLYIKSTASGSYNYQGLFGQTNIKSIISDLGLVGFYVIGGFAGGITGSAFGCTITNSYAIGNVIGGSGAGGITALASSGTITNSYVIGNVKTVSSSSSSIWFVCGGITCSGNVKNSYFAGTVNPAARSTGVGGSGSVENSFYDSDLAGNLPNGKETPKTTAEMKQKATYEGWDFANTWGIGYPKDKPLNDGRPYLQWQTPVGQAQIGEISAATYTGSQIKPTPSVKLNGTEMKVGVDFDYVYGTNTNVGTGTVTIVGKTTSFWGDDREFTFKINKAQVTKPKLNGNTFTYDGTSKTVSTDITPSANNFTFGGTTTATNTGSYTATATLTNTTNYQWTDGTTAALSLPWTINKAASNDCKVTMTDFTASGTPSSPVPSSPNGTYSTSSVSYSYKSKNDNSYPAALQRPSNAGSYTVTATFPTTTNYQECKATADFNIYEGDFTPIYVVWSPGCDKTYEYNGEAPTFTATTAEKYPLAISTIQKDAGTYEAKATLVTPIQGQYLESSTASCTYTITPKNLQISWTTDSVFTYNKMVQAPVPSATGFKLLRSNAHSAAGIYKEGNAVYAEIEDQAIARNYTLTNRSKNYEIKKKDLKPYFKAPADFSNIESNTDTIWIPQAIFSDPDLLRQILDNLLNYDGFAQDTITKEKDDASVLRNTPTISVIYATQPTAQKMLAKRVETTQTAVAIVNTDGVSADNYALAKRSITIMEILDEDTGTKRVLCLRGNYCTELSADVCTFINGEVVTTCSNIKRSCQIDTDLCIDNMYISECSSIGGTVITMSCDEYALPIKGPALASNAFRVWQTASGTVNIDLGYAPTSPVAVQIYNLQGKLISTEQANTRFATIKLNAAGGVYLFKAGTRTTIKTIK